jgi:PAS domain S-box-containing protein
MSGFDFSRKSMPVRFAGAVGLTVGAMLLRWALNPVIGRNFPYFLAFFAILLSARWFGRAPGLLAMFIGSLPPVYNVIIHSQPLPPSTARYWFSLTAAYIVVGLLVWLIDRQRRMSVVVHTTARLADERLEQLSVEVAHREKEQHLAAQLHAIVESSEDAIISKDLSGVIRSWNYGAEQIFGYSAKEAIGNPISLLVPPDRAHEESDILERILHAGRVKHFETVRRHKDGRQLQVSLTISPIHDPKGNVIGASHIARDISERKEFEEQLLQTQKLESLGVLAGGLAHDFNNLLTGIMGNASLARGDLPKYSPVHEQIDAIVSASERAAVLVGQMLAYAGKGRFVVERVDLNQVISALEPLIRTSIPRLVQLDVRLDPGLPAMEADPSQMQQLILNLAANAGEAIGEGHGTVVIETSWRETDAERQVVLMVKDTGCGMDESTKARMFDPFFTTKFTGRGLGLAAVTGIVRTQRGSISVETAQGRGTAVTVVLPASEEAEGGTLKTLHELRGYGNVLVVDDEDLVRNMARFTLERCGYTVEQAADGRDAVEKVAARSAEFAAVVLDLTMPVMSGEEALIRIREIRPDLPVLLSSGFSEAEAVKRFADRGLAGFLQKPYTATALARKVKAALRQKRSSAEWY